MTSDETVCFELLDKYAREQHSCFVAEFFLNKEKTEYVVCFRPVGETKDSVHRYACRYVRIGTTDVASIATKTALTDYILQELDAELSDFMAKLHAE
jgi:hypothetical protein